MTSSSSSSEPSLAYKINALYSAKVADTRQTNRLILLGAIAACVGWIRVGYPMLTTAKSTASNVQTQAERILDNFVPDMDASPKAGETLGGHRVTSAYGPRSSPCAGCSSDHAGVDVALSHGAPQFVPDNKPVTVSCFTYSYRGNSEQGAKFDLSYGGLSLRAIHLAGCTPGTVDGGKPFGTTGTSGTGPHMHLEVYKDGALIPPPRSIVAWAVSGVKPQPLVSKGGTDGDD